MSLVAFIEEIGAEFSIGLSSPQHMISDDQNAVSHGDCGPFRPPARRQSSVLSGKIGIFAAGSAVRRFDQRLA